MSDHLTALTRRLSNEKVALAIAKGAQEIALRTVWVAQIEKEIASEYAFLGFEPMNDDELLAELMA
jgi:hypothetical protein